MKITETTLRINKTETIYLCIDENENIQFASTSYSQSCRYARLNNCFVSTYPAGTLTNQ